MPRDTPGPEKPVRERGTYARHGGDPTLAGYLSSLLFLLTVPGGILLSYAGYWWGLYPYAGVLPAFAGLVVAAIAAAFVAMHFR